MRLRAHTPGGSNGFDLGQRRPELLGHRRQLAGEVAGLVDHVDQELPDHPPDRIGNRQRKLLGEMIGQRSLGRHAGFQIVVAVLAPAIADAGPVGRTHRLLDARALRLLAAVVGEFVFEIGAEPLFDGAAAGLQVFVDPVGRTVRLGSREIAAAELRVTGFRRAFDNARLALGGALEQGILFELPLDVGGQIQVRELQQLDGLHKLRRHHERLALPHL